jgi:TetR/AcrR family transcriptional regulator, repressor for lfrA
VTVPAVDSGSRSDRTRRRILDAAVGLLTKDAGASLAEVAAVAGLGRTTVHRYFATRESLLVALGVEAIDRVSEAIRRARPAVGPVPEVLARVVEAVLPLSDELRYLSLGPELWNLRELAEAWYPLEQTLDAVVARGQREGDLRPDLPVALVTDLVIGAVWSMGESVADGRVARRDAVPGLLTVLLHGSVSRSGDR